MKITKTQLQSLVREELGKSIQGLDERQNRQLALNEEIRKLGWTPLEQEELRQLIAEGPIDAATEFMTGPGTSVADIKDTDFGTTLGKLEGFIELLEWLLDAIPNIVQKWSGTEDADVAVGIKTIRFVSRVFNGAGLLLLKATKGLVGYFQKNPDIAAKLAGGPEKTIA